MILLLFTDDMAILADSPEELQNQLDTVITYCEKWGINVNVDKTQIVVFRERGGLLPGEKWTYNGNNTEVVNQFNYLSYVFNYTGSFNLNQEHLGSKAVKALIMLLIHFKKLPLKPQTLCQLFDAFVVGSILGYFSEIWGYAKSKEIERIHLKFCKRR